MTSVTPNNRRSVIGAVAMVVMAATATPSYAIETSMKQDLTAIGTIAVATAAAGPVGFVVGALGGGWLADQVGDADQLESSQRALASATDELRLRREELDQLELELAAVQEEQTRFAKMALDQLQLEMLFKTGDANLTEAGRERLALLATFLKKNPSIMLSVQGFADPRGDAAANMALSRARAERVAQQLAAVGVAPSRMQVVGKGESQSQASTGDLDAYAMERVVRIELTQHQTGHRVAEVTLRQQ